MSTPRRGLALPNGCHITHGAEALRKQPFADSHVIINEMSAGDKPFRGQFGFIELNNTMRVPRHIHMDQKSQVMTDERILVVGGAALAEIGDETLVIAPGSLVETKGGVPHSWTACPPGVKLPNGFISTGSFTMVYEYDGPTSFFPIASKTKIQSPHLYEPYTGCMEAIRIPEYTPQQVIQIAKVVIDGKLLDLEGVSIT